MKKRIVFNIVMIGILAAMAVILEKASIKIPLFSSQATYRITFYGIPLMIAGIVLGPLNGFFTGFVMAFISQIILSEYGVTPTTPLWMLPPIIWAVVPGVEIKLFKGKLNLLTISIAVILPSVLANITNSLALYVDGLIYGYSTDITFVLILIRVIMSIIVCVIYIPVLYLLCPRLKKLLN